MTRPYTISIDLKIRKADLALQPDLLTGLVVFFSVSSIQFENSIVPPIFNQPPLKGII